MPTSTLLIMMLRTPLRHSLSPLTRADLRELVSLPFRARLVWLRRRFLRALGRATSEQLEFSPPRHTQLLFVCHGNIYRSPAAAALFSRQLRLSTSHSVEVSSAGLFADGGNESPADAITIASEIGIPELREHRSQSITAALVERADVILVMDRANEAVLISRFPRASRKTVLLGSYAREGNHDSAAIPDPYGMGEGAVRQCFLRIERAVVAFHGSLGVLRTSGETVSVAASTAGIRHMLASAVGSRMMQVFDGNIATILMLHRFADPDRGLAGHDLAHLATNLEHLRKNRFNLCSVAALVARLRSGLPPLPRTVVVTVDDGYYDFAERGAPIFERYDCSATCFLVTSFVDGSNWLWHDQVRWLAETVPRVATSVRVGAQVFELRWESPRERPTAVRALISALKTVPSGLVPEALVQLSTLLGASVPPMPTDRYRAMSWNDVRALAKRGMEFGPHSHTHAILSMSDDTSAREEVHGSWSRLSGELASPSPVFCYPNGTHRDFGNREVVALRDAGLLAAVLSLGGACRLRDFRDDPYRLPRIPYEGDPGRFRLTVSGLLNRLRSHRAA